MNENVKLSHVNYSITVCFPVRYYLCLEDVTVFDFVHLFFWGISVGLRSGLFLDHRVKKNSQIG